MNILKMATAACAALFCGAVTAGGFSAESEAKAAASDVWVQNQKGGYTVEFVGDGNVVGLQFDIKDKNIVEGSYECGASLAATHIASCTLNAEEGFLRVIVFSMNNDVLADTSLVRVNVRSSGFALSKAAADAAVEISNVILSDTQGQNVTPEHL